MSKERVKLDKTVEITKDNRHEEELDIARVAEEQAHQLDHFREAKHEAKLGPERILSKRGIPVLGGPPAREEQQRIDSECKRCERRNVESICRPGLAPMFMVKTTPISISVLHMHKQSKLVQSGPG